MKTFNSKIGNTIAVALALTGKDGIPVKLKNCVITYEVEDKSTGDMLSSGSFSDETFIISHTVTGALDKKIHHTLIARLQVDNEGFISNHSLKFNLTRD